MKTISANLRTHLAQQYHTVATCWKVTLRDSTVLGFTDHDQNIVFDGVTYLASSGYTATNVVSSDALDVDNLELQGMLQSPSITEDDLRAGIWDFAAYEIFRVNWKDLTQGRLIQRVGHLGEVKAGRAAFSAELHGLMQAYTRSLGEVTSPACRASLGDARCQVNLAPFTVTGTVTGASEDNTTVYDTSRTEPGPSGGATISNITVVGQTARILYDTPLDLYNGLSVMLSEIDDPAILNALQVVREWDPSPPPFGGTFDVDVDISAEPAYTSGGLVTPLGAESGYFDFGVLTWLTGDNAGLSMEVRQYVDGQITLALPMPYTIQVGDTYSMHAGCDKNITTCRDRFDNIVNFRGEPYLPGTDRLVQVGRRS